jgi:hypothetical protein
MIILLVMIGYILISVYNYGATLAYLQRNNMEECDDLYRLHSKVALLIALGGFINVYGVLKVTIYNLHGVKYWKGERNTSGNMYYIQYITSINKGPGPALPNGDNTVRRNDVNFIDIWR